ncbi:hypothetical protein B0H12DRAFT_1127160 [Mycena haematopus]|nr:hypothetical protein B0H12DRAFT_1127160 [Mycena haematopus]
MSVLPCGVRHGHVPPEIVDQILRKLDPLADRHILCTCALVSHIWLALSRAILFSSIFISPFRIGVNDGTWKALRGVTTISPYVRDICLSVPPINSMDEWTKTHLPKLLAQFPGCARLRILYPWETIMRWEVLRSRLDRLHRESALRPTVFARLRRAFGSSLLGRRRKNARDSIKLISDDDNVQFSPVPADAPPPLSQVHTLYLDHPKDNVPIMALLALPSLHTFELIVRESDPGAETMHASLRACGPTLCTLILGFPWDLRIGRPSAPLLLTGLHTLRLMNVEATDLSPSLRVPDPMPTTTLISTAGHLLLCVLDAPNLQDMVISYPRDESGSSGSYSFLDIMGESPCVRGVCTR